MSGSLKQIAPKKWLVQYDVFSADRRDRRTERIEGATKKEAEAYLADRRAELVAARKAYERGEVVKDAIPLSELFGRFMAAKQSKIEESTLRRYEIFVRCYLVPAFGEKTGKTLHVQHLTDAYADWLENGRNGRTISPKTIRHIHETMRNILSWGVRYDWLSRNVATKIDSTDLPKAIKPKPKALTKDELRRLLDAAKHPTSQAKKRGYCSAHGMFYPAVFFSAYTGARRSEALALRWCDVDFERNTITIAQAMTETLRFKAPKNDQARTMNMPPELATVLKQHREAQDADRALLGTAYKDSDLVFAKADGSVVKPAAYGKAVLELLNRCGMENVTLHSLRDTHASLLAVAGVPIEVVSKRLGHSTIAVTMERYLDVYTSRDAAAAEAFGRLVG